MKSIEIRTEKISSVMALEAGMPEAMRELYLGRAYNLVYFGDKKELKRIEEIAAKRHPAKAKKK